jgi:acetyltransferase-like isoleucine patch superfamily enzyme
MLIKKVIKKLIGFDNIRPYNSVEAYAASGNLVYGSNCKLEGLSVSMVSTSPNYVNVKIGNDCYLNCNILLQSPNAQVIFGDGVFIGPDTTIFCYEKIVFENDIMVSWGCTFIDTNAHSLNALERRNDVRDFIKGPQYKNWENVKHAPTCIKNDCWVGFNSIITKGVTLEEGTVIGCGSVVTKNTEPYSVYGGNPAVYIKKAT